MAPKGTLFLITDEWIQEVDRRLEARGWTRLELAKEAGCSAPTVTDALNKKQKHTREMAKINKVLGMAPPRSFAVQSKEQQSWSEAGDRAEAAGRLSLLLDWIERSEHANKLKQAEQILSWLDIGLELAALHQLDGATVVAKAQLENARNPRAARDIPDDSTEIDTVKPKRSRPLPFPVSESGKSDSDRSDKTGHGKRSRRPE